MKRIIIFFIFGLLISAPFFLQSAEEIAEAGIEYGYNGPEAMSIGEDNYFKGLVKGLDFPLKCFGVSIQKRKEIISLAKKAPLFEHFQDDSKQIIAIRRFHLAMKLAKLYPQ